jgi:uncharacterized protein (DUF427 family)
MHASPPAESVWDYPRPPRVEPVAARIRVEHGGATIADTREAVRVLETSHPPAYYLPMGDVRSDLLRPSRAGATVCEWKGEATYFDLVVADATVPRVAWTYLDPRPGYAELRGRLAFYPGRVDAAWVEDERVRPQAGGFYGGWITSNIAGPFKGDPGTGGW